MIQAHLLQLLGTKRLAYETTSVFGCTLISLRWTDGARPPDWQTFWPLCSGITVGFGKVPYCRASRSSRRWSSRNAIESLRLCSRLTAVCRWPRCSINLKRGEIVYSLRFRSPASYPASSLPGPAACCIAAACVTVTTSTTEIAWLTRRLSLRTHHTRHRHVRIRIQEDRH